MGLFRGCSSQLSNRERFLSLYSDVRTKIKTTRKLMPRPSTTILFPEIKYQRRCIVGTVCNRKRSVNNMFFRRSSLTLFPLAARTRVCRTFPTWAGWWTCYSTVCTFIRTFDTLGSGGRVDMRGQAGWPRTFPPQFDSKGKIRPKRVFVFFTSPR